MYHDDNFDPTLENDFEHDIITISDSSSEVSVNSNIKKQRKENELLKKMDKGYHTFKRIVNKKIVKVEIYNNQYSTGYIRDAISGHYNKLRIGTSDENLFFKVNMSSLYGKDKENVAFFFDSPDQYERITGSIVSSDIKESWRNRNINEQIKLKKMD